MTDPLLPSASPTRELLEFSAVTWHEDSFTSYISDLFQSIKDAWELGKSSVQHKIGQAFRFNLVDFTISSLFFKVFSDEKSGFISSNTLRFFCQSHKMEVDGSGYRYSKGDVQVFLDYSSAFGGDFNIITLENTKDKKTVVPIVVGQHMMSVVIDRTKGKNQIIFYDPQGFNIESRGELKRALEGLRTTLGEGATLSVLTDTKGSVSHEQKNRFDCGVIAMALMNHLIMGQDILNFKTDFQQNPEARINQRIILNNFIAENCGPFESYERDSAGKATKKTLTTFLWKNDFTNSEDNHVFKHESKNIQVLDHFVINFDENKSIVIDENRKTLIPITNEGKIALVIIEKGGIKITCSVDFSTKSREDLVKYLKKLGFDNNGSIIYFKELKGSTELKQVSDQIKQRIQKEIESADDLPKTDSGSRRKQTDSDDF